MTQKGVLLMTTLLYLLCQLRQLGYTLLTFLVDAVRFLRCSLRSLLVLAAENLLEEKAA